MKINRKDFLEVLQAVKPGLASKENVQYSTRFIFINNTICTYNDEISVSHKLDGDFEEFEGIGVQSKELYDLVSKLTHDELTLEIEDDQLIIKCGKAKAGVRIEKCDISEYVSEIGTPEKWKDLPSNFVDGLSFCMFSVGNDVTQPLLTCICVQDGDVVSSDDIRITHYKLGKAKIEKMLIPSVAARSLPDYKPKQYAMTPGWLSFKNDTTVFSCRTFGLGEYEFERALKHIGSVKGDSMKLPSNLQEILTRAEIFSLTDSKDERIRISVIGKKMIVEGENQNGWFKEETVIRHSGDDFEFEVNPALLGEILKRTDEVIVGDRLLKFTGENFDHVVRTIAPKGK